MHRSLNILGLISFKDYLVVGLCLYRRILVNISKEAWGYRVVYFPVYLLLYTETQVKVHIIQGQRSETTLLTHLTPSSVEILACGGHLKKWPGRLGDGNQIT